MKKILPVLLIIGLLCFILVFQGVAKETEITIALPVEIDSLDPHYTTLTQSWMMLSNIFEPLVRLDDSGEYKPLLASGWEVIDDLTWQFSLKENILFHNGEPFNADSVYYSFNRLYDPELQSPALPIYRGVIKEIKVIDDYTVQVITEKPYAPLLSLLSVLWMVPPEYVEEVGLEGFQQNPVGTGPYQFHEWVRGHQFIIEINENYWRELPDFERVIYRPIPDASTRMAALLAEEVDVIHVVPLDRINEIEQNPNVRITTRPGEMVYIGLNTFLDGLDDPIVRQALNYAIDKESIIDALLIGKAYPMNGPFFRVTTGYQEDLKPYPYDPDKAKELLAEAGIDQLSLTLITGELQGLQKTREVGETVVFFLQEVGIDAELSILESAAQMDLYGAGKMEMFMWPWASYPESGRHLEILLHSQTRGYYYQNEETDVLIDAYMTTLDPEEREKVGNKLHEHLYEMAPFVFMYEQEDVWAVNNRVDWEAGISFLINAYDKKLK